MHYLFKHVLMRDTAYGMQLGRRRRALHRQAAEAIENAHALDLAPHYADLVYHYHHAEDAAQECHYATLAGKVAAEAGSYEAAVHFLSRALELTPADDLQARYDLLLAREEAHHIQGAREAQVADLAALVQLEGLSQDADEDALINVGWAAAIARRQARYAEATSDYTAAITAAQRAVRLARDADCPVEAARAQEVWGRALWRQGDYPEAQAQHQQGIAVARTVEKNHVAAAALAENLKGLGNVAWNLGEYANARTYYERALVIFQDIGNQQGVGNCLNNLGNVVGSLGDYTLASEYLAQALAIKEEIGERWGVSLCLNNLGVLTYVLGDYDTSRNYFMQALAICREIDDREGEARSLASLGEAVMIAGQYAAAGDYLQQAIVTAQKIGSREVEGVVLNTLGALALFQHQFPEARGHYRQAITIHTELEQPHYLVEDHAGMAQVMLELGNLERARGYARQVMAYLQENPTLEGTENPMRAFRFTRQVLTALAHPQADDVLARAVQVIQAQVENISDPGGRQMYLAQPHHRVLWTAWKVQ